MAGARRSAIVAGSETATSSFGVGLLALVRGDCAERAPIDGDLAVCMSVGRTGEGCASGMSVSAAGGDASSEATGSVAVSVTSIGSSFVDFSSVVCGTSFVGSISITSSCSATFSVLSTIGVEAAALAISIDDRSSGRMGAPGLLHQSTSCVNISSVTSSSSSIGIHVRILNPAMPTSPSSFVGAGVPWDDGGAFCKDMIGLIHF